MGLGFLDGQRLEKDHGQGPSRRMILSIKKKIYKFGFMIRSWARSMKKNDILMGIAYQEKKIFHEARNSDPH